jgi:hypothetical protein
MGVLNELVNYQVKVEGGDKASNFKINSLYFFNKYRKSDKFVERIPVAKIRTGGFYFLHYLDDSNWMKWSPVFAVSVKRFDNLIILYAINLNFIPIEIRVKIFDKLFSEKDFQGASPGDPWKKDVYSRKFNFENIYKELVRYKIQYSVMEFNVSQIKIAHKIHLSELPKFLYSQHPKNKYDPKKLIQIWNKKAKDSNSRDKEMSQLVVNEMYDIGKEISDKYVILKDHIKRLQSSFRKYGRK